MMFKKLTINDLKLLKSLYKVKSPKFIPTFGLLLHFIERFEKHPEWQDKVQFLTNSENSLKDGTFLMNYCNYIVCFNSFEPAPYRNLEKLLTSVAFSEEKKFWAIEVYHSELIYKLKEKQNLETLFDETSKCTLHSFNKEEIKWSLEVIAKPPEGFYCDSLKPSDVSRMTAISHYKLPSWYFENVIKHNLTTGMYTNDGKLVAWTGMHDVGESGMTNVDQHYRRQQLATAVIVNQAAKVFDADRVIFGHVFHKNEVAMQFFNSIGRVEIIGRHRWFNLRKQKNGINSHL